MAPRKRVREAESPSLGNSAVTVLEQENLHDDAQPKEARDQHMHMTPFQNEKQKKKNKKKKKKKKGALSQRDEESNEKTDSTTKKKKKKAHSTTPHHEEFKPCIHSSVFAGIGTRGSMEDTHVVMDDVGQLVKMTSEPTSFYAVFDGHGGEKAAEFARDHLFLNFLICMDKLKDVASALLCAFLDTDNQFKDAWLANNYLESGTTALAAVIVGCKLYVANAGDCRAVICRNGKALDMSVDHDPRKNEDEHKRIIEAGGFLEEGYLNGIINMSRGIGNWHHKGLKGPGPFISTPEIKFEHLTEKDDFMIVASDGLFKSCTSQNAVNFVRGELEKHNNLEKCARDLAQNTWRIERDSGFLTDNSTVVIVSFRKEVAPSV